MANTRYLTLQVETYVRERLAERHGQSFSKRFLQLTTGGSHEFDAVSNDGSIVVSIKAASGLTKSGKNPAAKVQGCIAELYYLSLVDAPTRILALTTPAFHTIFTRRIQGSLATGITIDLIPLPPDMQAEVDKVVAEAGREVSPAVVTDVIEEEIT